MIKVSSMTSNNSYREVPNQFIIETDNAIIFQSYNTIIAKKESGKIYLDENKWKYSITTSKYRNQFLGLTTKETEKMIKEGKIELVDLNK